MPCCRSSIGVPIGRFIDRGYDAVTTWMGGGLLIVGCAGFVLFPNLAGILVATAILGTAHLLFVVSQQIQCTRCGTGPGAMERAIGNYMVANAAGQGVGPYIVALAGGSASVPPTQLLFAIGLGGAVLTMAFALLTQSTGAHKLPVDRAKVPLRDLLFAPGLTTIIVVSVVTVVAQDLIVVYLPLLGSDRGMSVDAVGTLLAIRAVASMLSRLIYARLHVAFGRIPLTLTSTFVSAIAYTLLAFPLPLPLLVCRHCGCRICAEHFDHRQHRRRARHRQRRRDRHGEFAAHHGEPHRPVDHSDCRQPGCGGHRHRQHLRDHRHRPRGVRRRRPL